MIDRRTGVKVVSDGKEYTLRFGTNEMAKFQASQGEGIITALGALDKQGDDIIRLRALIWAGLSPEVSLEEAGFIIDDNGGFRGATELILSAAQKAFPPAEKSADPLPATQTTTPSTGG